MIWLGSGVALGVMASVTRGKTAHRVKRAAAAARIVEATERLLRSGERFTEIPVERLLAEADVSRSTFYVHFADKSALLVALAERGIGEVMAAGELWWRYDHRHGPADAASTVRELIKVYRRNFAILRTLHEVGAYDDAVHDLWRDRRENYSATLAQRVRGEQEQGRVAAEVDVELTAAFVGQMVDAAIMDHVAHGSARRDRQVAETIARMGWLAYYGRIPDSQD